MSKEDSKETLEKAGWKFFTPYYLPDARHCKAQHFYKIVGKTVEIKAVVITLDKGSKEKNE